jgi:hypothetical protein
MGLPIPKGTADKIITILGGVIMVVGVIVSFAKGQGLDGIAAAGTGIALIAKGMEEFIGGNVSAAVADVVSGVEQVKASEPAVEADVKTIEANPVPVAIAAAETVAAKIDEQKVA